MKTCVHRAARACTALVPAPALAFALALAAAPLRAQDRAELESTRIVGNRELPKVLHIVPWKPPPPGRFQGRPPHSVLDDALQPLDRAELRREIDYGTRIASQPPPVSGVRP